MRNFEEKIAIVASTVVGGSMVLTFMAFIFLSGLTVLTSFEVEELFNLFILKTIAIGTIYIISIYLVATLPGKSEKRRLFSWTFSIIFHASLLLYVWLLFDKENAAFIVGMVECIILVLSILGVSVLFYNKLKMKGV